MNQKMRPMVINKHEINQINELNHEVQKFEALSLKVKQLKLAKELSDVDETREFNQESVELPMLKKIDDYSFVGYFVGYGFFNFFYWIDMILN